MWFSGLRGAIAFALAFAAREDFPGGAGEVRLCLRDSVRFLTAYYAGDVYVYFVCGDLYRDGDGWWY